MSEIVVETTPSETVIEIEGGPTLTTTVEQELQTVIETPAEPVVIDLNSGARGEPGSAILTGPAYPTLLMGSIGDLFIVTEGNVGAGDVYTKTSLGWVLSGNIRGPMGGIESVNGQYGPMVLLTKGDVGLSAVDNTSDLAKPISTAAQSVFDAQSALINTKRNLIFTGGEGATATQMYTDVLSAKFSAQSAGRYIRINTNLPLTASHMVSVHITVDGYSQGVAEGWFSAYMYNNLGGTILTPRWINRGRRNFTFIAAKDSNNKLVLVLDAAPNNGSVWSYPKVVVDQVYSSFGARNDSLYAGWTASISDDISDLVTTPMSSSDNLFIEPGTTSQYYRGDKTWQILDKSTVGLSNVRNVDQVDLTSAQTIGGAKTFTSRIQASGPSVLINNSNDLSSAGAVLQIQNATGSPAIYFHAPSVTDGQLRLNATNSRLQFVNGAGTALASGGIEAQIIRAVTLYGDGSNITAINGSQVTTGTVADARLSTNVVLLNNSQTVTGAKTFTNPVVVPTPTASNHAATKGYIDSIVDAAPGTLDTLNELAAALGDDPNFATTVTNSIATKVALNGDQTITGKTVLRRDVAGTGGNQAPLQILNDNATGKPAIYFHNPGQVDGTFGMNLAGEFETRTNADSGFLPLRAGELYEYDQRVYSPYNPPIIGSVTGLQSALDSKSATTHAHALTDSSITGEIPNTKLPTRLRELVSTTVTDWNNATTSGWFHGTTNIPNAPSAAQYIGFVIAHTASWVTQTAWPFTTPGYPDGTAPYAYRRVKNNGTWGAWFRVSDSLPELDTRYARQAQIPVTLGTVEWLRVATIDGIHASNGASITLSVAGQGNFGSARRTTDTITFSQRGAGSYFFEGHRIGSSTSPWIYYVKPITDFVFELWARRSTYDAAPDITVLHSWNGELNADGATTTQPSGLTLLDDPASLTDAVVRVVHTGSSWPARPTAKYVEWVGPNAPSAATANDTWVNTSV